MRGGREPFALNGFFEDFCRVGDGTEGRSSSPESSESMSCGCHRASAPAAAAKMFLPALGALVAPLRRGDREREAIDMGDCFAISTSIGVLANIV